MAYRLEGNVGGFRPAVIYDRAAVGPVTLDIVENARLNTRVEVDATLLRTALAAPASDVAKAVARQAHGRGTAS